MADNPNVEFTIDSSPQTLEGELIPPKGFPEGSDREEKKPISRAAAVKSIGQTIGAVHWVGAKLLEEPALELDKDEKKVYGEVGVDLLKAYNVDLATHPKAAAWLNFLSAAFEIDGPRVVLIVTKAPGQRTTEPETEEPPPLVFPEKPRQ